METELGKIADMIQEAEEKETLCKEAGPAWQVSGGAILNSVVWLFLWACQGQLAYRMLMAGVSLLRRYPGGVPAGNNCSWPLVQRMVKGMPLSENFPPWRPWDALL